MNLNDYRNEYLKRIDEAFILFEADILSGSTSLALETYYQSTQSALKIYRYAQMNLGLVETISTEESFDTLNLFTIEDI
jgi:mannose/fructose-specific phosphotransferase system component IIA